MRSHARSRFSKMVRRSATLESLERRALLAFTAGDGGVNPFDWETIESLLHPGEEHHHDHDHGHDEHDHDEYYPGGEDAGGGDYVLGNKWASSVVTYGYSNLFSALNTNMSEATIRDAINEAFLLWSAYTPLRFIEQLDPGGTINDNNHNVESPQIRIGAHYIDGSSGPNVLAHAYGPGSGRGGDLHFDTGNTYNNAAYFMEVAAHEIGHAIGLGHPNGNVVNGVCPPPKPAIMDACIQGRFANLGDGYLFTDDINGIQAHYGGGLGYVLDRFGTLHVGGTQSANTFYISYSGSNITIEATGGGMSGSFTRSISGVNSIEIYGRGGNDTFWVYGVPSGLDVYINGEDGNDVFQVGNGDFDTNILGNVYVTGGDGFDETVVNDLTDTGNDSYYFDFTWFEKSLGGRLYSTNANTEQLSVIGNGDNNTFYVNAAPVGMNLSLLGLAGDDVFQIGGGDYDFWVNSNVSVSGGAGNDLLFINDVNDVGNDTHTLAATTYRKSSATEVVTYGTIERVRIDAGNGASTVNTFNLNGAPSGALVTVNAFAGGDIFNVGDGDWDTNLPNTTLNLNATGGATLSIDDTDDAGATDVYDFNGTNIVKTGGGQTQTIAVSGVINFRLDASASGTDINANDLIGYTTINGGGGDDNIVLSDSFRLLLGNIQIIVPTVVDPGPGLDTLNVAPGTPTSSVYAQLVGSDEIGTLSIGPMGQLTLPANGDNYLEVVNSATIAGRLNLNDNTFIRRNYGTSLAYYYTRLQNGRGNGNWAGLSPAIISSTANAANGTALGYANAGAAGINGMLFGAVLKFFNPADLIIRYTLEGDANLNRSVDFNDLLAHAGNFGASPREWWQGNFDYDNAKTADFNDLLLLAKNFGSSVIRADSPSPFNLDAQIDDSAEFFERDDSILA